MFGSFDDSVRVAFILCAVTAVGVAAVAVRRHRAGSEWRSAIGSLVRPAGLAMSLTAIAAITIYTPYMGEVVEGWRQEGGRAFNGNLIPFRTIRSYLDSTPSFSVALQLFGNVALFTPLGFFLRLGAVNRPGTALGLGFGASVLTEALQYVLPTGRAIDVDDVILNTMGVLAGVLLASAFNGLGKRRTGVAAL